MSIKVGVVGATGMVGEVFVELLQSRKFPASELRLFASQRSQGQSIEFHGRQVPIEVLSEGCFDGLDLVFFSSGDDISKEWAPKAVRAGAFAVDNSAAFRMDPNFPLVVPEVNADLLPPKGQPTIIANPNCSTIQLVVALDALKGFGLERVFVASYQAVSGAGKAGRDELVDQLKDYLDGAADVKVEAFPHQIAFNCVPQIGSFNSLGFCSEEMKIMNETQKILRLPGLPVSAFTVRIPAINSHSEAVWVRFKKPVGEEEIRSALSNKEGLVVMDDPSRSRYPTAFQASGTDPVYVGRLHRDLNDENTWLFWVVADNLRKGAALNGIQIAEKIFA
jgi:aspartate-semialdehyde dehydrogenase